MHNKRNREQRIRISIYQKSCIVEYTVSNRLKFLFSVPYSFYCAEPLTSRYVSFSTITLMFPNSANSLANENGLKWIEMDSDFQKYWFTNVKMNAFQCFFWKHFYSFIEIEHISILFNLKIILAFSVHNNTIVNTV